jgi:hypothetical protein
VQIGPAHQRRATAAAVPRSPVHRSIRPPGTAINELAVEHLLTRYAARVCRTNENSRADNCLQFEPIPKRPLSFMIAMRSSCLYCASQGGDNGPELRYEMRPG